jgi:competence/damage-inducible protein CinA-like protein
MNAELVSIGTEILLGEITDTNSGYIARQLRDIGVNVFYFTSVGDNLQRITQTLQTALQRSDLVITTGGVGPTVDDMTRDGAAAATGRPLVFHQHLLDQIAERFQKFGVAMSENNRRQAYAPEGAILIENPVGTAPCFIVEGEKSTLISLPGVPREMKYLLEKSVLPYLRTRMGLPAIIKARILHTAGIGESMVDDAIPDLMRLENPTVGLAAHSGQTDIRLTVRANHEAEADALLAPLEAEVRARLGRYIFGVDGEKLPDVIGRYLRDTGHRLTLIEAGTGGVVAVEFKKSPLLGACLAEAQFFASVDEAQRAYDLPTASSLSDIASGLAQAQPAPLVLAVLYQEGVSALAVKTPHKQHARELTLGSEQDVLRWGLNWGLGYLWRYLREAESA